MLFCRAAFASTPVRVRSCGTALAVALLACVLLAIGTERARAEPTDPSRIVATSSVGAPLRLAVDDELDQDALAPAYADALLGYVLPGQGTRHGVGLGLSLNLEHDGGYTEPVRAGQQLVAMPAYLAYRSFDASWFALGHLGVPFALTVSPSVGLELALGIGYRVLAGVGAYAELGANAFLGADSTVHPTLSLELGFVLDYEVLP